MIKPVNTSNVGLRTFDKELNKDLKGFHLPANSWSHARNATNNSSTGDLGKLGNEPSNWQCGVDPVTGKSLIPYIINGILHITQDKWLVYSTDETDSEIGIFDESDCSYFTLINDPCLNFSRHNLIIGACRATSTCTYRAYWDDGRRNVSRTLEFSVDPLEANLYSNPNSPIPWIQTTGPAPCYDQENTENVDCDKLRLEPYIQVPCLHITKGITGGTLLNGSYLVSIAYAIDGQKISDWYTSNVQAQFEHQNSAGSIDVVIEGLDTSFDQMIVAITSVVNQQVVTRKAGIYNTHQGHLSFDMISNEWPTIPISEIPIITPIIERSDAMYNVNNYLLRSGPTSREDFNYQPFANRITAFWLAIEYPADYYVKGGNNVGYMRDEVYAYFIRWIYDTGDKSSSYHIPGRPPKSGETNIAGGADALPGYDSYMFEVENGAWESGSVNTALADGGRVVGRGYMGYHQSSEVYPTDRPEIWNGANNPLTVEDSNGNITHPFSTSTPPYSYTTAAAASDLCGKPIRHHRFPENCSGKHTGYTTENGILVMGVQFGNIQYPIGLDGRPIPGIVGYEILRGSRNGNKTVLAKGLINNMHQYTIPGTEKKGLIPNYPYNDLNPDKFLVENEMHYPGSGALWKDFQKDVFTFHSPETNFTNPYLSAKELKIYGNMTGNITGQFRKSEKHPQEKLLTNTAFWVSAVIGVGAGLLGQHGQKTRKTTAPSRIPSFIGAGFIANYDQGPNPASTLIWSPQQIILRAAELAKDASLGGTLLGSTAIGTGEMQWNDAAMSAIHVEKEIFTGLSSIYTPADDNYQIEESKYQRTPALIRTLNAFASFFAYFTEGADAMFELIRSFVAYRDFVLRYHSHCFYDGFVCASRGNKRRLINEQLYIGPQITEFSGRKLNNLYRPRTVALEVHEDIANPSLPGASMGEISRIQVSDVSALSLKDPTTLAFDESFFPSGFGWQRATSHYAALKQRMRNQYSQINGIKQLPASYCMFDPPRVDGHTSTPLSKPIFGGDTYLNRYTEKNTFFMFYDWLYDQPDGAQLDYMKYRMVPYPRYWANFEKYEMNDFTSSIDINDLINGNLLSNADLPITFSNLEGQTFAGSGWFDWKFSLKYCWMYLFISGVRDFYCESEINTAYRDWGEKEEEQFYNPYGGTTDTEQLFRTDLIKVGNFYKYDQSLSYGKIFMNYVSWGHAQPISYNPYDAATCFVYYPKRLVYSLPIQDQMIKDAWSVFLPNNYKDFLSKVSCIKTISKSGAIIFFNDLSPVMFQGVDQLQTEAGVKLTIGDGGLFKQPMQNVVNADKSYEYGSCQNRLSVINTPTGLYWLSQNQGKVYHYAGSLTEISGTDLRWWFTNYLPYKLTEDFPNFQLIDNPVSGIGCQTIYDNESGMVYFCKKDYKLRDDLPDDVSITYDHIDLITKDLIPGSGATFWINDLTSFELGDEVSDKYFEDASWTISYDPKIQSWISWHDWHPNLLIPGKNTFLSILKEGIWVHNDRCDSYCNYYGIDFPFEIEHLVDTKQMVTSLRSLEYYLEVYKYAENCYDRFHVLDFNFDELVIHNTEQTSGLLRLNLRPKNSPWQALNYPLINTNSIDILYTKEEQKYRINQFWDVTADRGEYNAQAQRVIWNTQANGYIRDLNPNNLNYNKNSLERKKFRHYVNSVFLKRRVSGNRKMLVILDTNKVLTSQR